MAKSLRSKRRRKMRAEKRIVNAKKELVKLKHIAAKLHGSRGGPITKEALESNIPDVEVVGGLDSTAMLIDSGATTSSEHEQTLASANKASKREQMKINTQWMNQRKIKSIKSKIKKHNQKKGRRVKSAGLSSRKTKRSIKK